MSLCKNRGSVIIGIILALVLTITTVVFTRMIRRRTPFTINQVKRQQAINCAEAALYETFNRFRHFRHTGIGWDPANLAGGGWASVVTIDVADPDSTAVPKATYPVNIDIRVTGAGPPYQIEARIGYNQIRM